VHAEKVGQDGSGQIGRQGGEGAVAGDANVDTVAGKPGGQGMGGDWLARHQAREQPLCRAAVGVDREATLRLGLGGQLLEEVGQPGWK